MLFFKDVYSSSCNLDYTPWRKDVSYVSSIAWVLCISGCLIISSEINNSLSLWGVTEDPGVALGMLPQPSVTCIVRKSCTQSPTSAKESLMLRSASLTSGRRQNWASSHSVATWCQMNMSSSPLKPWRLPVFVPTSTWWKAVAKMAFTSNCDFTLPCHLHQQDVVLCWGWQAPDKYLTFLWKALGHGGQGPQVIMSIRTTLQNTQHVIEALCRAKFKFPGHQKFHVSKKWAFTKCNVDKFEDMVAEKQLILDGCGVKYIPNCGPWDKGQTWYSWESQGYPLLKLTNKSYFLSKERKKWKSNILNCLENRGFSA